MPCARVLHDGQQRRTRNQWAQVREAHQGLMRAAVVHMVRVATRELRNDTAGLLRRVAAGEDVVITVRGEPVARLVAAGSSRRRWVPRTELAARLAMVQADPGLRRDLRRSAGDSTDDLGELA